MIKKFTVPPKKNNRFTAPHGQESFILQTLPSFIKSYIKRIGFSVPDVTEWLSPEIPVQRSNRLSISWIGHSTFLIQVAGVNILTDPIFGNISPFFPRTIPVGIPVSLLPLIDYVLISHNHRDHMDAASLSAIKRLNPRVTILVPHGDKAWFDKRGFRDTHEYEWWQEHETGHGITCTFLPAIHWSQRGLFDKNKSLWGSWLIKAGDTTIYFAGDTAYGQHFAEIADAHHIDTVLMPIGPCEPADWLRHSHVDAEQAVQAFLDLKARHFVPMHWGTFPFGTDSFDAPIERLKKIFHTRVLDDPAKMLHLVKVGQQYVLPAQVQYIPERKHYEKQK